MNKIDSQSKHDSAKWLLIGLLAVAGIAANFIWVDFPLLYRGVGVALLFLVVLSVAYNTAKGKSTWQFFLDARLELRKVVWPTRQETVQTTFVVVGVVIVMAILLWILDALLLKAMTIFTG